MFPIVMIPGHMCSAEVFRNQVQELSNLAPVTVAYPLEGDSVQKMAEHILQRAPDKFILIGFSMGGYISLEILRQAPERVHKLALIDTSARPEGNIGWRRKTMDEARLSGVLDMDLSNVLPLVHPERQNDGELISSLMAMRENVGRERFLQQSKALMERPDSRLDLHKITVPAMVMVGEQDIITSPIHAKEMAQEIPHSTLVVIPECGHVSLLEKPVEVNNALVEWLVD